MGPFVPRSAHHRLRGFLEPGCLARSYRRAPVHHTGTTLRGPVRSVFAPGSRPNVRLVARFGWSLRGVDGLRVIWVSLISLHRRLWSVFHGHSPKDDQSGCTSWLAGGGGFLVGFLGPLVPCATVWWPDVSGLASVSRRGAGRLVGLLWGCRIRRPPHRTLSVWGQLSYKVLLLPFAEKVRNAMCNAHSVIQLAFRRLGFMSRGSANMQLPPGSIEFVLMLALMARRAVWDGPLEIPEESRLMRTSCCACLSAGT